MTDELEAALTLLGLDRGATTEEVRAAYRRLAKQHHPDVGGGAASMGAINDAVGVVLAARDIDTRTPPADSDVPEKRGAADGAGSMSTSSTGQRGSRAGQPTTWARDAPSFVIEALPVEAFEALLLVAAMNGDVLDDDPPYRLEAVVRFEVHHAGLGDDAAPVEAWCRLDLVPDAGASTVSLIVAIDASTVVGWTADESEIVDIIRDWWIRGLNELDWPDTALG
ncbi:MAG: DnaJ domain-containing protein [Actinomycetota bacterium]